jgi:hypothetical protein
MRKVNRHLLSRFLMLTMLCYLVRMHKGSSICLVYAQRLTLHLCVNSSSLQHDVQVLGATAGVFVTLCAGPHKPGIRSIAAQQGPGV